MHPQPPRHPRSSVNVLNLLFPLLRPGQRYHHGVLWVLLRRRKLQVLCQLYQRNRVMRALRRNHGWRGRSRVLHGDLKLSSHNLLVQFPNVREQELPLLRSLHRKLQGSHRRLLQNSDRRLPSRSVLLLFLRRFLCHQHHHKQRTSRRSLRQTLQPLHLPLRPRPQLGEAHAQAWLGSHSTTRLVVHGHSSLGESNNVKHSSILPVSPL